jgi:hypothetical protein
MTKAAPGGRPLAYIPDETTAARSR